MRFPCVDLEKCPSGEEHSGRCDVAGIRKIQRKNAQKDSRVDWLMLSCIDASRRDVSLSAVTSQFLGRYESRGPTSVVGYRGPYLCSGRTDIVEWHVHLLVRGTELQRHLNA